MKLTEVMNQTDYGDADHMTTIIQREVDNIAQNAGEYYKHSDEALQLADDVEQALAQLSEDEYYKLIDSNMIQDEARDNYDGADGGDSYLDAVVVLSAIKHMTGER